MWSDPIPSCLSNLKFNLPFSSKIASYLATIAKTFVHNVQICDGFLINFPTGGDISIRNIEFRLV